MNILEVKEKKVNMKKYISPEIFVTPVDVEDIVFTSGGNDVIDPGDNGLPVRPI